MLMISQKPAGLYPAFPDIHFRAMLPVRRVLANRACFLGNICPCWGVQCRQEQDSRQAQDNFLNVAFIDAIMYVSKNISYFIPVRNRISKSYTSIPIDKTDLRQSRQ